MDVRSNPDVSDAGLKVLIHVCLVSGQDYVGSSPWPYDVYTAVRKAIVKEIVEAGGDYNPLCSPLGKFSPLSHCVG